MTYRASAEIKKDHSILLFFVLCFKIFIVIILFIIFFFILRTPSPHFSFIFMIFSRWIPSLFIMAYIVCIPLHASASGFLGLSIGYYNAFDGDRNSADFRAEYISDSPIFLKNLKPWGGAEITTNGTLWAGGGLLYSIPLNDKITVTPSFGAGLYYHGSDDINLGYPIEFRTQLELDYAPSKQNKIGLALSHTSNASLDHDNPGAETLVISYKRAIGLK